MLSLSKVTQWICLITTLVAILAKGRTPDKKTDWVFLGAANIPASELQALSDLYQATNGQSWIWTSIPWNFSIPQANPCADRWQGVRCTQVAVDGFVHITELNLDACGLDGTLPSTLSQLTQLQQLDLCINNLHGTIPLSLSSLVDLTVLVLCETNLEGIIPAIFGNMTLLQMVSLADNKLTGPIPDLSAATQLTNLDLSNNGLTGPIPAYWSQFSQLVELSLYSNRLSGTISPSLGALPLLQMLYLYNNSLHGSIPSALGNLSQLINLDVDANQLTGTIPSTLGSLPLLQMLYLDGNSLHGSIPSALGNLSQLLYMAVSSNELTGTIPSTLGSLPLLQMLYLDSNSLHGSIPSALGNLSQLVYLEVSLNHLTGTIPTSLGNLSSTLVFLRMVVNYLTGPLPAYLGVFTSLQVMIIYNNYLTGTVPASLGQLQYLFEFSAADNLLSGSLPSTLSNMSGLNSLIVSGNHITGTLDGVFDPAVQRNLMSVVVNDNRLTGTLPETLFHLPALRTVVAATNCFHGHLPGNICTATLLQSVVLDGLSSAPACKKILLPGLSASYTTEQTVRGSLPSCLFQLPSLLTLHLSGNGFSGRILPNADTQVTAPLLDLSLSHNFFTGSISAQLQDRPWTTLDLSYNRLSGVLSDQLATHRVNVSKQVYAFLGVSVSDNISSVQMALSLENNRLSGKIPSSLLDLKDISILQSNDFSCSLDGSGLPAHDSAVNNYQCGSQEFDVPYYVWLGLTFAGALFVLLCLRYGTELQRVVDVGACRGYCSQWTESVDKIGFESDRAAPAVPTYRHLQRYLKTLDTISALSLGWMCVMVAMLVPLYATLSHFYGTHAQSYAWTVSAAYLSGTVPFALEFVFWLLILSGALFLLYKLMIMNSSTMLDNARVGGARGPTVLVYVLYLTVNIVIVGGVNIAYVYVVLYQSSGLLTFAQIFMPFFKLVYNGVVSTALLQRIVLIATQQPLSSHGYGPLRVLVVLINNIAIPFVVVLVVSPNCFYNVFAAAPAVHALFAFEVCYEVIAGSTTCYQYALQSDTSSYDPPFVYSYQCSSSLITYYAPAYVNMCIVSVFVMPLVHVASVYLLHRADRSSKWYACLSYVVPRAWCVPSAGEAFAANKQYFGPLSECTAVLNYVALLFTFGVVFPPLGVALAVALVAARTFTRLKLGRFLLAVRENNNDPAFISSVDEACGSIEADHLLRLFLYMLGVMCCCFYSLFLFDTLGDAQGFEKSLWVLIVVPLLPVVGIGVVEGYNQYGFHPAVTSVHHKSVEMRTVTAEAPTSSASESGDTITTFNVLLDSSA